MTTDRDLLIALSVRTLGIPENLARAAVKDLPPQQENTTMPTLPDLIDQISKNLSGIDRALIDTSDALVGPTPETTGGTQEISGLMERLDILASYSARILQRANVLNSILCSSQGEEKAHWPEDELRLAQVEKLAQIGIRARSARAQYQERD